MCTGNRCRTIIVHAPMATHAAAPDTHAWLASHACLLCAHLQCRAKNSCGTQQFSQTLTRHQMSGSLNTNLSLFCSCRRSCTG